MYEENPIGVENVSFQYYIRDIRENNNGISDEEFEYAVELLVATEQYIFGYDVAAEEYEGTDYNNERYDPGRMGKDLNEIDIVHDYDYSLLEEYKTTYISIDRKRALAGIFYKICDSRDSDLERQQKIWEFCSKISVHSYYYQPVQEDGQLVYDPIILLELHEMRCGQIARLACDLFDSVGYQTRLVQLGGHVIAEIYYDQSWHYFDADIWNGYQAVEENGNIFSVESLSSNPYLIDGLGNTYYETYVWGLPSMRSIYCYPSYFYFCEEAYSGTTPCYYYKVATEEQTLNWYYGWNCYETVSADFELNAERFEQPAIPYIERVEIDGRKTIIAWTGGEDKKDIIGYRIFVSRISRGWEYTNIYGDQEVEDYVVNRYNPSQYDKIAQLPYSEIYNIDTTGTEIELNLEEGIYYISIMPYDAHGESAGREIYLMSNELQFEIK